MDVATLVVTFGGVVVAGAAAVAAIVQARAAVAARIAAEEARNESRIARDEAAELAREANSAFVRQAEAQEEANRLARLSAPRLEPKFKLEPIANSRWALSNVGTAMAENAQVLQVAGLVKPDDDSPRNVGPGDSLFFVASRALGRPSARIALVCEYVDGEGVRQTSRNEITLP